MNTMNAERKNDEHDQWARLAAAMVAAARERDKLLEENRILREQLAQLDRLELLRHDVKEACGV